MLFLSVIFVIILVLIIVVVGDELFVDVSLLYLGGLIGIFLLVVFLYFIEVFCLFNGIWYLFCFLFGYFLLIVYFICNMIDCLWGK